MIEFQHKLNANEIHLLQSGEEDEKTAALLNVAPKMRNYANENGYNISSVDSFGVLAEARMLQKQGFAWGSLIAPLVNVLFGSQGPSAEQLAAEEKRRREEAEAKKQQFTFLIIGVGAVLLIGVLIFLPKSK